jgi:hypothetical protein
MHQQIISKRVIKIIANIVSKHRHNISDCYGPRLASVLTIRHCYAVTAPGAGLEDWGGKTRSCCRPSAARRLAQGPPSDFLDDNRVVLLAFAVIDAGLQDLGVHRKKRELLPGLADLVEHELRIF